MDKVKRKLHEIDKINIKNYLDYDDKKITENWVYLSALANIVLMALGVIFSDEKLISGIVMGIITVGLLGLCIFFKFKIIPDKENLYFYYGCSMTVLPITSCYLSCVLFQEDGIDWYIPAIVYAVIIPIIAVITLRNEFRAIITNKYANKHYSNPTRAVLTPAIALVIIVLRYSDFADTHTALVFGVLIGLCGLILATNPYFFLKSYCYKVLQRKKTGEGSAS